MIARRPTKQRAALADALADTDEFVSRRTCTPDRSRGQQRRLATVYRNLQAACRRGRDRRPTHRRR